MNSARKTKQNRSVLSTTTAANSKKKSIAKTDGVADTSWDVSVFVMLSTHKIQAHRPCRSPSALWWSAPGIASTCHESGPRRADSHSSRPARPAHRGAEALATASVLWWACREPEPSPKPAESSCAHFVRTLPAHHAARHGHGRSAVSRLIVSRSSAETSRAAQCGRAVSARGRFAASPLTWQGDPAAGLRAATECSSARPLYAPSPPSPLTPNALQTAPALADALLSRSLWY